MARNFGNVAASRPGLPDRPSGYYVLAEDASFGAGDCVCCADARSPLSEGEHPRAHISVMLAGAFHARSRQGARVVGPGALLLGNASAPYEYRHVDAGGDRSIVFDYGEALLEDMGRSLGMRLTGARAFEGVCIPASPASAEAVVLAQEALRGGEPDALREAALTVAEVALAADRGGAVAGAELSSRQARRITRTLRYVEAHGAEDCSLDALAALAGLSSFHFLRLFRAMTGQTPRQFVIATRLRMAAMALRTRREPITEVAMDAGFGDLSHFTASFTRVFGVSPRDYRKRHGVAARAGFLARRP
ncbi:helix-turn-helix transcriptional regulator [Pyxidicoccus xibeiensis]|uniref:helix-turn-helix transcriptional regulator n=1 Tax=Pyxidicoccus xibeiensis TaxID=2906759 RepID=UPI0020A7A2A9|nr:helix-turn-helix domain-containing protein [Pyxidicoccus xibeiensis]MCP3136970.1 AraC family transcriptional regulator [Pyxidicoccus xibeiensis]